MKALVGACYSLRPLGACRSLVTCYSLCLLLLAWAQMERTIVGTGCYSLVTCYSFRAQPCPAGPHGRSLVTCYSLVICYSLRVQGHSLHSTSKVVPPLLQPTRVPLLQPTLAPLL